MKASCHIILFYSLFLVLTSCRGQSNTSKQKQSAEKKETIQLVGGNFENAEYTYYGIPKTIGAIDTSAGWALKGQKILLTGTVFQQDGKTPAPDVLIYYYQTNTEGKYLHKPSEKRSMPPNELGQTHGYIRGWVKTNSKGQYFIYTVKPGTYPTRDAPAHVHVTIKEPNDIKEYYIDDFVFDDDPLLTSLVRKKMENRCGSGVLRMVQQGDLQIGERNIILGLNIPAYPNKKTATIFSGKNIGEDVFSFTPYHAWGPDKGTRTCPVCKYGWYQGVLYFVGNQPNWTDIKLWLTFLEAESRKREKYLKVYFVYGNELGYNKKAIESKLEKLGAELKLEKVALTFVPSFADTESDMYLNNINPDTENTFILYKRSKVTDKFINLPANAANCQLIADRLDESINEYFDLPPLKKG
jgi:protocatechuate 3,4-dioxygenase beta subunit